MKKLNAALCKDMIGNLKAARSYRGISLSEEIYLQALEIALPVLEQQSGWVSCGDRMPEREGNYLVFAEASNLEGYCDHNDIAAYQGGEWSNEFIWLVTHWQPLPAPPKQESTTDTYRQIENDGWIEWSGGESGEMPVSESSRVELRWSRGNTSKGRASNFGWANRISQGFDSIIAYRVIESDGREG